MASNEQLEAIAARLLPDFAPAAALERTLFLTRVMSAGSWNEVLLVEEHFGRDAFRKALAAPPNGIFDRESWSFWHNALHRSEAPWMPDDFFTVYPWFKNRHLNRPITWELIANTPSYETGPIRSCDEEEALKLK